jgi:hypothetical protein
MNTARDVQTINYSDIDSITLQDYETTIFRNTYLHLFQTLGPFKRSAHPHVHARTYGIPLLPFPLPVILAPFACAQRLYNPPFSSIFQQTSQHFKMSFPFARPLRYSTSSIPPVHSSFDSPPPKKGFNWGMIAIRLLILLTLMNGTWSLFIGVWWYTNGGSGINNFDPFSVALGVIFAILSLTFVGILSSRLKVSPIKS